MSDFDPSMEILYAAIASPIGVVVSVSDFQLCQARLYKARKQSGDPSLDCLQLRRSPINPETELWIVKGTNDKKE